ncbi:MAG: zf-HC2 domain-containing protein [Planctomycetia bacterium]|jgi:anti-sigma factor RsiW|nr:zf-HC2 domain-containing protein [Planctomycetia bacterium]
MRCEELLAALGDYVDGQLDPALREAFEQHIRGCAICEVVIDNIRNTITLYSAGVPVEMPPELHEHLSTLLRDRWRMKFAGG